MGVDYEQQEAQRHHHRESAWEDLVDRFERDDASPSDPSAKTRGYIENLQTQIDALFDRVTELEQASVDCDGEAIGSSPEDLKDQDKRRES